MSDTSSSDFAIDFPDGTLVNDYVSKKFYKVGDPVEEDKAVDEFIKRHGLTGEIPERVKHGNTFRYILIVSGILLIAFSLWKMYHDRRKSK